MNGQPSCIVDGMKYTIRTSSGGPAWTIIIEAGLFRLDVDLVPALKFPESRWLEGRNYRKIPQECRRGYWMVVPEPHMAGQMDQDTQRSWHICLQSQEDQLFNNTYLLRKTFQLLEKLRDAQGMDKLAPYYIKTLFFWEIDDKKNTDPTFWQRKNIATLFEYMLNKLYEALDNGSIQYFWNKKNNLIGHLNSCTKNEYKGKFMYLLENIRDYKLVAKYLLTSVEYEEYQQFL
ncbi:jg19373 [Pararge aegeria aegeria]|uniref:Jg19373 protein n=1 Tax=Pararge aegeria aegeria TaxID=348720 RepID=A0A8S4RAQ9_9NEOP|nr:jg19373 [Pararge aegeria aegeria]